MYLKTQHKVLYRDLRPDNILFTDENPMELKLCDFGNARRLGAFDEVRHSKHGPERLMSPEMLSLGAGVSFEHDVWQLGVLAYTLLLGMPPFR